MMRESSFLARRAGELDTEEHEEERSLCSSDACRGSKLMCSLDKVSEGPVDWRTLLSTVEVLPQTGVTGGESEDRVD